MVSHRPSDKTDGAATFALLGERWTYLILREIFFEVRRFGQIQRALAITPTVLTARLNSLVDVGILERHRYHVDPDWFEYHLTSAAREIVPAVLAVAQWSEEHLSQGEKLRALRHAQCGQRTRPVLTCSECGIPIAARDLKPETIARDAGRPPTPSSALAAT
jgi:DNA-binding HxlR family transcriptional regulator